MTRRRRSPPEEKEAACLTREEFTGAVLAYSRAMYRAARAMLPCDADAEDAVGQAVLLAWQSIGRLRTPESIRPWLVKITVNCARRQLRRRSGTVSLEDVSPATASREDTYSCGLWEEVLALPPEQRAAVVLFYYEDLPIVEISRLLRVPEGTVKSRLNRARQRLRQALAEDLREEAST